MGLRALMGLRPLYFIVPATAGSIHDKKNRLSLAAPLPQHIEEKGLRRGERGVGLSRRIYICTERECDPLSIIMAGEGVKSHPPFSLLVSSCLKC
jgi:hypothetical protein